MHWPAPASTGTLFTVLTRIPPAQSGAIADGSVPASAERRGRRQHPEHIEGAAPDARQSRSSLARTAASLISGRLIALVFGYGGAAELDLHRR